MQNIRSFYRALTALLLPMLVLTGFFTAPAQAAAPATNGNPNVECPAGTTLVAKFNFNAGGYLFEKPAGNESVVTISDADADGGSWSSTQPIAAVVIKGGSGASATKTDLYDPAATSGSFDNVGLLNKGGNRPDISNIQFCGPKQTPPPPPSAPVRPILECVVNNGGGSYTAFFGYRSDNTGPVAIPVGPNNKFHPTPADRGQPTVFQPGRTPFWPDAAFAVDFNGTNLVWALNGRTATASANSTPCSYHIFVEKEWVGGIPANLPADYKIVASSRLGTAECTYGGDTTLDCVYSNAAPALDNKGLWVPVNEGYTVSEQNLPAGYSPVSGVGDFAVPADCVGGREGLAKYCTHTVVNQREQARAGELKVVKTIIVDGNTPADPSASFSFCASGPSFPTPSCQSLSVAEISGGGFLTWGDLIPGSYTVTEGPMPHPSWSAVGPTEQSATVVAGATASLTFTNKRCCLAATNITLSQVDSDIKAVVAVQFTDGYAPTNADVTVEWATPSGKVTQTANTNGDNTAEFSIPASIDGTYTLTVKSADGFDGTPFCEEKSASIEVSGVCCIEAYAITMSDTGNSLKAEVAMGYSDGYTQDFNIDVTGYWVLPDGSTTAPATSNTTSGDGLEDNIATFTLPKAGPGVYTFKVTGAKGDGSPFCGEAQGTIEVKSVSAPPSPAVCYAAGNQKVIVYEPGKRKNNTPVLAERRDTSKALGLPQNNDTLNFTSLGFGGTMVMEFTRPIVNDGSAAPDIKVWETSYGDKSRPWSRYPEAVKVFASQDGTTWVELGTTSDKDQSYDLSGLSWAKYIKLVDTSDPRRFGATDDGFDVDAVEVLTGCVQQ